LKEVSLNSRIAQQEKQINMLHTQVGALGNKLEKTEDVNKRVLIKTLDASKKYEDISNQLVQTKKSLIEKESTYGRNMETVKREYSDKTKQLITDNTKRVVAMMAQIEGLKKEVMKRDSLLDEKEKKEQEILVDFVKKFKDITSARSKLQLVSDAEKTHGTHPAEGTVTEGTAPAQPVTPPKSFGTETVEAQPIPFNDVFKGITTEMEEEEEVRPFKPDLSVLEPMVERAVEQGESDDAILDSLVCSGYDREDVRKVLVKLKNV